MVKLLLLLLTRPSPAASIVRSAQQQLNPAAPWAQQVVCATWKEWRRLRPCPAGLGPAAIMAPPPRKGAHPGCGQARPSSKPLARLIICACVALLP